MIKETFLMAAFGVAIFVGCYLCIVAMVWFIHLLEIGFLMPERIR